VGLYEDHGLAPGDIASNQSLELEIVELILRNNSALYRETSGVGAVDKLVSDEVLKLVSQRLINTALSSQDERLATKVQMRLVDEARGRLDKRSEVNIHVNFDEINRRVRAMKLARATNGKLVPDVVDIPPQMEAAA
jgi:hypothetical protein